MHWYLQALRKYVTFSGRARRMEFWMFALINFVVSILLELIDRLVIGTANDIGLLSAIYGLAVILPAVSVCVRRLHDIGKSGWWYWILFLPIIGLIVLLVFTCRNSQPGENRYGPNPKGE